MDNFNNLVKSYPLQSEWVFPLGNASFDIYDFTKDSSQSALANLKNSSIIHFVDTIHFDFSRFSQIFKNIGLLTFRVNTFNQFPDSALSQIYFADSLSATGITTVDSVFNSRFYKVVVPATLNPNGSVNAIGYRRVSIVFSDTAQIHKLINVKYAIITGNLINVNADTALYKYYNNYRLNVQAGFEVGLNFNTSNF